LALSELISDTKNKKIGLSERNYATSKGKAKILLQKVSHKN